jgi:hypothetical protein
MDYFCLHTRNRPYIEEVIHVFDELCDNDDLPVEERRNIAEVVIEALDNAIKVDFLVDTKWGQPDAAEFGFDDD